MSFLHLFIYFFSEWRLYIITLTSPDAQAKFFYQKRKENESNLVQSEIHLIKMRSPIKLNELIFFVNWQHMSDPAVMRFMAH